MIVDCNLCFERGRWVSTKLLARQYLYFPIAMIVNVAIIFLCCVQICKHCHCIEKGKRLEQTGMSRSKFVIIFCLWRNGVYRSRRAGDPAPTCLPRARKVMGLRRARRPTQVVHDFHFLQDSGRDFILDVLVAINACSYGFTGCGKKMKTLSWILTNGDA